jgi:CHASE2 domain-containing sensor protein
MSKLVILNLGKGNFYSGFAFVTVQIQKEGNTKWMQFKGSLPAAPNLLDLCRRWQLLYDLIYEARSINIGLRQPHPNDEDIIIDDADVTHVSDVEFYDVCDKLQNQIDTWLDADEFRNIERQLRMRLAPDDEIRFIIQTEDNQIRKLPWHTWRFFKDYPLAEVGLSAIEFEPRIPAKTSVKQVRILAIFGESTGINIDAERRLLSSLPGAKTVFLVEPKRHDLDEQLWDKQGWDILFFAGHSSSTDGETGQIYINNNETLTIYQLKNALKKAIECGLQIAIFNSCDGLGLAQQLDDLHIPQIIVMREPVADKVAQEFLKHFLKNFAEGQSFYLAVRQAREKLQGLESEFPGASWLPIICQNPVEVPLTWEELRDKNNDLQQSIFKRKTGLNFNTVLLISLIVTSLVMGVRSLNIFQSLELKAFDHFMQTRPQESEDKRLLLVGADEKDIRTYGYPLPDAILTKLLDKLKQYQPSVIGLNIVRDQPVPKDDISGHKALISHFKQNQNMIAVCAFNNGSEQSIAPPPQIETQVGFVDLYDDKAQTNNQDYTVRRYLLSRSENAISEASLCTTKYSFGWQLVYRYLNTIKIPIETVKDNWKFGSVITKRLQSRSGGYQNLDARGNQVLINYRNTPDPQRIAQQVSVRDVLNQDSDRFDPTWVKDRVILIGVIASSVKDPHNTPLGEMRSLYIHAHLVSQLLSTVEDHRPMLWWIPEWGEILWIFCWTLTGSGVIWRVQTSLIRGLALQICGIILYLFSWTIFSLGGWIPLIPTAMALVAPWGVISISTAVRNRHR